FHVIACPPRMSLLFPYTTLFRSLFPASCGQLPAQPPWNFWRSSRRRSRRWSPAPLSPAFAAGPYRYFPDNPSYTFSGRGSCTARDRKEHTSELQSRFDLVCRLLL